MELERIDRFRVAVHDPGTESMPDNPVVEPLLHERRDGVPIRAVLDQAPKVEKRELPMVDRYRAPHQNPWVNVTKTFGALDDAAQAAVLDRQ